MAKKHYKEEDGLQAVEQTLNKTELFIQENQKTLTFVVIVILLVVAAYLGYQRYIQLPNEREAQAQMFMAERYFEIDSFNLALNGDGNYLGFNQIMDNYSGTRSANLAKYYTGVSYLRMGKYQQAIDFLSKYDSEDEMVNPISKGDIGDANMELGNKEEAVKYYMKAVDASSNNFTAPIYLMKAGKVLESLNKNEEALKLYTRIDKEYHKSTEARSIEKYITRVKIKLGTH